MTHIKVQIIKEKIAKPFVNTSIFKYYTNLKKKFRNRNNNKTVTKSIDGINFELQLNQLIDYNLYYNGCFEKYTSYAIENLVKPGMIVFDLGANIGCHTLPIAKKITPKGKVYAFEPMEWALNKLRRNIALNSFTNIEINDIGLSDISEELDINFRTSWTMDSSEVAESNKIQKVRFTTLDEFIANNGISKVDLIKIDVDGYEPKVFAGAINCLAKFKPTLIMEFVENKENLINTLTSFGYKFYSENDFKLLPDPLNYHATTNLIVIHDSKIVNYSFLKH